MRKLTALGIVGIVGAAASAFVLGNSHIDTASNGASVQTVMVTAQVMPADRELDLFTGHGNTMLVVNW